MSKQAALDAVETTLDAVEGVQEAVVSDFVEVATIVKNNPKVLAAVSFVSVCIGGAVGYFSARKALALEFEKIATDEIRVAKEYYKRNAKAEEFATPESTAEALGVVTELQEYTSTVKDLEYGPSEEGKVAVVDSVLDLVQEEGSTMPDATTTVTEVRQVTVEPAQTTVVTNVFNNGSQAYPGWDQDQEESKRAAAPHDPYVISEDEYLANEPEHEQNALTYFESDDILIDERDDFCDEDWVGSPNLMRFGQGTRDNNLVYIRNDKLAMDFVVSRSKGSYAKSVHGYDDSLAHSDWTAGSRKTPRFRSDDG